MWITYFVRVLYISKIYSQYILKLLTLLHISVLIRVNRFGLFLRIETRLETNVTSQDLTPKSL